MSIVSNTRVDIVARGVIKACLELGLDPAEKIAIFRIPGAWEEEGFKILEKYGVEYADRSVSMHEAARRAVEKIGGRSGAHEHPRRRGHDVHRPGHHRPRGGQPDARVPRLRHRREDRRRRHAGPPGPRGPRRAGLRHRRPGRRAPRRGRSTARSSPSRPRSPRTPCSRRSRTASSSIVIVTERIPRRDVAQMVELATLRGARIIGPNCLGIIVPDVIKMGGIGGPAKDAAKAYTPGPIGVISRSGGMTTEMSSHAHAPPASASRPPSRSAATRSSARPTRS